MISLSVGICSIGDKMFTYVNYANSGQIYSYNEIFLSFVDLLILFTFAFMDKAMIIFVTVISNSIL